MICRVTQHSPQVAKAFARRPGPWSLRTEKRGRLLSPSSVFFPFHHCEQGDRDAPLSPILLERLRCADAVPLVHAAKAAATFFLGGETAWKPFHLQLEGCDLKWNPAAKESDDEWVIGYFEGAFEI